MTDVELSEESLRHVEAGAAAHRRVVELAARLQDQLQKTEQELKIANLDLAHLRIINHDLAEKLDLAEGTAKQAVEARIAYETLINLISHQLSEFVPTVPPSTAYREPYPKRMASEAPRPKGPETERSYPKVAEKPAGVHDRWGNDDSPESALLRQKLAAAETADAANGSGGGVDKVARTVPRYASPAKTRTASPAPWDSEDRGD